MDNGLSWVEMCEVIADAVTLKTGNKWTGERVFNYSPSGELFHIPGMYVRACKMLNVPCKIELFPDGSFQVIK